MKRIALLVLLAVCCSCASAGPPKPLLWKVSDADNEIYLLGSFHLLKADDYPLAAQVDAAFEDAENVLLELSPQELSDPALAMKMAAAAQLAGGRDLQQILPAATWKQLEAYASQRGIPVANLKAFEPWFVSLLISITEMQRLGLNPEFGLDRHFAERAGKANKPAAGLETGAEQIALFDGMSEKEQLQSLQDTLDDLDEIETAINKMHGQWRAGDGDALFGELAAEMKGKYPQLYQRINVNRNIAWMPKLQALLRDKKDDTLVVVGAMHLLGADGVVARLKAKGYKVERL